MASVAAEDSRGPWGGRTRTASGNTVDPPAQRGSYGSATGLNDDGDDTSGPLVRPPPSTDEILIGKEKVALIANVSSLIAGFTVVALVELSVPEGVPDHLTAVYSLLSTILIVIHMFATLVAVCALPSLELMLQQIERSPEDDRYVRGQYTLYRFYVDLAWSCSMGIGILLFLAELIVVVWVKVASISFIAAAATTAMLALVIVLFVYFGAVLRSREGIFLAALVRRRREKLEALERAQLQTSLQLSRTDALVV